jgi:hypothetical protein
MNVGTSNYRKLYSGQPSTSATTLYTAPANTTPQPSPYVTAVIKEIWLVNTTSTAQTVTIGINGTSAVNQIIPAQTIQPNTAVPISDINKALSGGDTIQALQSVAGAITVHIDGIEVQ